MDRTNARRLLLASGVLGGFVVGWSVSTWRAGPTTVVTPPAASATDRTITSATPAPTATTVLSESTATAIATARKTPGDLPSRAQRDDPSDATLTTLVDEPARGAETISTRAADRGTTRAANLATTRITNRDTNIRRSVARGRIMRGIRRLFGLGPAPRRIGGRAVRHLTSAEPEVRRALAGTVSTSTLRTAAGATRDDGAAPARVFGTRSTLTSGLIDASGTRTAGLAPFTAPPTYDLDPGTAGACCFDDGACVAGLLPEDCDSLTTGRFLGGGTTCAAAPCVVKPATTGGCCLGGTPPECVETFADDCAAAGGVFGATGGCAATITRSVLADAGGTLRLERLAVAACPGAAPSAAATFDGAPDVRLDPWMTAPDDGSCGSFWSAARCPIPAGLFGPGSRPYKGRVCLRGVPLGPVVIPGLPGVLDFGATDTLIRRAADPFDRCDAPFSGPVTVDMSVERMRLEGVEPLVVTFDGSDRTEIWNLRVEVDDGRRQPTGALTAYKEHPRGGRFDTTVPICPTLVLTRFDDPRDMRVIDYCAACDAGGIVLETIGAPWVDSPGGSIALPNPVPTSFHPGVRATKVTRDADCNENGFLDECDFEDGVSFDRNGNGVPDECECGADLDASGDVGVGDVSLVLLAWGPCEDECRADLDGNGTVDMADVFQVVRGWGVCD